MRLLTLMALSLVMIHSLIGQQLIEGDPPKDEIVYQCAPCGCAHDGKHFSGMGHCPSCHMPLQPTIAGLQRASSPAKRPTVGMFLFHGVDVMDVSGPLSVFEHAGLNIVTFAKSNNPIRVGRNLELKPEFTFENLPVVDILVFPGGGMAESNPGDPAVVQFIKDRYASTEVLFSVCSGAFFLGEAGVLDGQRATTFASMIPMLAENYPKAQALNHVKYTDNGKVVTSAGLSSGIDAAFHVVAKYYGVGRAQDIANHMEYPWKRENDYARSQLADNFVLDLKRLVPLFSTEYFYAQGDNNYWELRYKLTEQMQPKNIISLLTKELEKKENWTTTSNKSLVVKGTIQHPVLGLGKVELAIKKDTERGNVLIVKAERNKKYLP